MTKRLMALLLCVAMLLPCGTAMAAGFEVTSVKANGNGQVSVKWTDTGANGPYEVLYMQKVNSTFNADNASVGKSNVSWTDGVGNNKSERSRVLSYLVPGQAYWIQVKDASGKKTEAYLFQPSKVANFSEGSPVVTVTPRKRLSGGAYSDLKQLDANQMKAAPNDYGLYVRVNTKLTRNVSAVNQFVLTTPIGIQYVYTWNSTSWYQGDNSRKWDFFGLDHFTNVFGAWSNGIPGGEYKLSLYIGGKFAASGAFTIAGKAMPTATPYNGQPTPTNTPGGGGGGGGGGMGGHWEWVTEEVDCSSCTFGNCRACNGRGYTERFGERVPCDPNCGACGGSGKLMTREYKFIFD